MITGLTKWKKVRLGDLIEIKHGYAFKGEYFGPKGTHVVLTPGNFFDEGGFKQKGDKEKWYSGEIPAAYVLQKGDLLVAMTEQAEGLLGSAAIVPKSGMYLHNQRLGLVQNLRGIDSRFLYYIFNSTSVRQQIRSSCTGVKVRHTSPSRIYEVKVPIPDLPTQRKIAGILSAYDDLIENNLRRIKILEEMAQSLYREWFVHFRFPGHESAKFVDSALDRIPKGWEVKTLDELTEVILDCRGKTPKKLGGDCLSQRLFALRANPEMISPALLFYSLISEQGQARLQNRATGTTVRGIRQAALREVEILVPHKKIRELAGAFFEGTAAQLANLHYRNQNLRRTRDMLLFKLLKTDG